MYTIEGNIGAGKTTFLRLLEKHIPSSTIAWEPVNTWKKSVAGQSLLANFYENPKRWTYTFEMFTLLSRIKQEEKIVDAEYVFTERSIYSGYHCFARNNFERGNMTPLEWQLYKEWFEFLTEHGYKKPTGIIYLHVDSQIAYQRIKKRNRNGEENISCSYIKQIGQRYQDFLVDKRSEYPSLQDIPVLVIDVNKDFETDESLQQVYLDKVKEFIVDKTKIVPAQRIKELPITF